MRPTLAAALKSQTDMSTNRWHQCYETSTYDICCGEGRGVFHKTLSYFKGACTYMMSLLFQSSLFSFAECCTCNRFIAACLLARYKQISLVRH